VIVRDFARGGFYHFRSTPEAGWSSQRLRNVDDERIEWIRLFEIDGDLFYFVSGGGRVLLLTDGGEQTRDLGLRYPPDAEPLGIYPYISSRRTGTPDDSAYIDAVLLSGDSRAYPDGPAYYLRIPKASISGTFD
jgi:hypothetical protein